MTRVSAANGDACPAGPARALSGEAALRFAETWARLPAEAFAPLALEFTHGPPRRVSSPPVGEDRGGGARRPAQTGRGGWFNSLLGPRDPPPTGRLEERPSFDGLCSAPTRGAGADARRAIPSA